jgi:hypothetical protein
MLLSFGNHPQIGLANGPSRCNPLGKVTVWRLQLQPTAKYSLGHMIAATFMCFMLEGIVDMMTSKESMSIMIYGVYSTLQMVLLFGKVSSLTSCLYSV